MYGLRRGELFLRVRGIGESGAELWHKLENSHGNIYMGEKDEVQRRFYKLNKFYRHIPIELYKFTERELEELVILKLKG